MFYFSYYGLDNINRIQLNMNKSIYCNLLKSVDLINLEKASRCVATNSLLVVGQLPPPAVICCFKELLWTLDFQCMCL
jgi:hypothetical protein